MGNDPSHPDRAGLRLLCCSVAFVWLATGLLVLHPYYREQGRASLGLLGLPDWLMYATCAAEVALGLRVALGRPSTWVTLLQAALILGFTALLAFSQPMLLASPYGMLTKNVPLLAVIGTAWLVNREGWTARALWLLRVGVAFIWITEGIVPKILFQQPEELAMVPLFAGVPAEHAPLFLAVLGACQAASGVAVLLLRGRLLRLLLAGQVAALVVLPLMAGSYQPWLFVHPFGPLTKNVPILAGTVIVLLRTRRQPPPAAPS
jgi:DoxX-like family